MNIRHAVSPDSETNTCSLTSEASFSITQTFTIKAWNSLDKEKLMKNAERTIHTSVYREPLTAVVHLYKRMEVMKESLEMERPDIAEELAVFLQFLREIRALMRTPE